MKNIIKYPISSGVDLYYIKADRFKTVDIDVSFYMPLSEESASYSALIAPVLKSGCTKYPTAKLLNTKIEELYGASISAGVSKSGDTSVMHFSMQYVNPRYLSEDIGDECINLLCDVITDPYTENRCFNKEFFELERKNLLDSIESIINDKKAYASLRCTEEMFKGDAYSIYSQGKPEVIKKITPEAAFDFYKTTLLSSKCNIFICGDVDIDKIFSVFKNRFSGNHENEYPKTVIKAKNTEVKRITEDMDVEQGKLCIGFSTGITPTSEKYYALALFNRIFGGTATSKLFNNVREKLSLAYYVSSSIERMKGIMFINAGIEIPTFSAAYDEIFVQLKCMQDGDFSDEEFAAALASATNSIGQLSDNPGHIIKYYEGQLLAGTFKDPDEYLEKLKSVTREEVIEVANSITLDTVYFLKNKEVE